MNINLRKALIMGVLLSFLVNSFGPVPMAQADEFRLPAPGVMVRLSPEFNPPILKGIKVHPDNPFRFDFILDKGDSELNNTQLKDESSRLIKYFLASLTIPEKDLWVNLSPYEKDRIIPQSFGLTEMGRDLLAEDYMLKQITASLIYPEDQIGKKFWKRVYEEAAKRYGTTNMPVNTFNKVWIVPEKAVVYENVKAGTAYVVESKLKVMLEQDYLSLAKHEGIQDKNSINAIGSQVVREIVIPELTKEVNENKNFIQLRQVYNSLILATWYKKKIKDSILSQAYSDKNKVAGVSIDDPQEKEKIYQRYLQAFKKGVYNYIKEDAVFIPSLPSKEQGIFPRKYFSGGISWGAANLDSAMIIIDHWQGVSENLKGGLIISTDTQPVKLPLPKIAHTLNWKRERGSALFVPGLLGATEHVKNTQGLLVPSGQLERRSLVLPEDSPRKIAAASSEETRQYINTKQDTIVEIEGMDKEIIKRTMQYVSQHVGWIVIESKLGSLLENYLMNFFFESQRPQVKEAIRAIQGNGIFKETPLIDEVLEHLDYLLHPDVFELIVHPMRRMQVLTFIANAHRRSVTTTKNTAAWRYRYLDLLIGLLEHGYRNGVRIQIKSMIKTEAARSKEILSYSLLMRIKMVMMQTRDDPQDFIDKRNQDVFREAVLVWEQDDQKRLRIVRSLLGSQSLSSLTHDQWIGLINEVRLIGSAAFYQRNVSAIQPFAPTRKFGIESEYTDLFGNNDEIRFPDNEFESSEGHRNSNSQWKKAATAIRMYERKPKFMYRHIHVHVDQTGIKETAFSRMTLAHEAVLRLGGYRYLEGDDESPPLSGFLSGEEINNHHGYINISAVHDTVEARFFGLPFYFEKEKFDLDRLQSQVALIMQLIEKSKNHPEDSTVVSVGLPTPLGMDGRFIDEQYIAKCGDQIFKGNLEGKINFLRLLSSSINATGQVQFRMRTAQGKINDDTRAQELYSQRGLSLLYRLHLEKGRWDVHILDTIRGLIGKAEAGLKTNPRYLEDCDEMHGLIDLLMYMATNGENEEEIYIGIEGIMRLKGKDSDEYYIATLDHAVDFNFLLPRLPSLKDKNISPKISGDSLVHIPMNILRYLLLNAPNRDALIKDLISRAGTLNNVVQRDQYASFIISFIMGDISTASFVDFDSLIGTLDDEGLRNLLNQLEGFKDADSNIDKRGLILKLKSDVILKFNNQGLKNTFISNLLEQMENQPVDFDDDDTKEGMEQLMVVMTEALVNIWRLEDKELQGKYITRMIKVAMKTKSQDVLIAAKLVVYVGLSSTKADKEQIWNIAQDIIPYIDNQEWYLAMYAASILLDMVKLT